MIVFRILAIAALFLASPCLAATGLIEVKSPMTVKETADKLSSVLEKNGINLFARIDHSAGAKKVGKELRPTELLIFGNPKNGTPFIECSQTVAIDLPLKILVWQDASSQVWMGYNDLAYLAERHGAADCPAVKSLTQAVQALVDQTLAKDTSK